MFSRPPVAACRRSSTVCTRPPAAARLRHDDLGAVGERRREVQHRQVGVGLGAAGALDGVDHSVALRELVHPGLADPPGHVDDDRRPGRRCAALPLGAAPFGPAAGDDAAIATGLGSERRYQSPAPTSVIDHHDHDQAVSSARDNESSRSLMPMGTTLRTRPAPFRDAHHARRRILRGPLAPVVDSTACDDDATRASGSRNSRRRRATTGCRWRRSGTTSPRPGSTTC